MSDPSSLDVVRAAWPAQADLVQVMEGEVGSGGRLFDPDVEVQFVAGPDLPPPRTSHGMEGLNAAWRDWLEPYSSYDLALEGLVPVGEELVLANARVRATTRRDGVEVEHTPAALWTVRDGRVVRVRFFLDPELARRTAEAEAAGGEGEG